MHGSITKKDPGLADPGRSIAVLYQRETGKRLTYEIRADVFGNYAISLDGKVLKQGTDTLVAMGLRKPGPEVRESAINYARVAVLYLHGMPEE